MSYQSGERNPIEMKKVVSRLTPAAIAVALIFIGSKSCGEPINKFIADRDARRTATTVAQATYDALPPELRPTIVPSHTQTLTPEPSPTALLQKVNTLITTDEFFEGFTELQGLRANASQFNYHKWYYANHPDFNFAFVEIDNTKPDKPIYLFNPLNNQMEVVSYAYLLARYSKRNNNIIISSDRSQRIDLRTLVTAQDTIDMTGNFPLAPRRLILLVGNKDKKTAQKQGLRAITFYPDGPIFFPDARTISCPVSGTVVYPDGTTEEVKDFGLFDATTYKTPQGDILYYALYTIGFPAPSEVASTPTSTE